METSTSEHESEYESPENDHDESTEELADTSDQADDSEDSVSNETNALALSDEEFMAMAHPAALPSESGDTASDEHDDESESTAPADSKSSKSNTETETETTEPQERDIQAEHAQIFSPIKAGGKEIEVKSVDEVISLMQKGADYHRKTQQIAAHMKTVKTLERAGIKPEDLNHLIALHNKDPQAINKLIADAEIDPLDIDPENETVQNYQPKNYTVSDSDLALDETLEALKTTPTYNQMLNVVGNVWDQSSREYIASNPQLMTVINDHIGSGIYGVIEKEMNRQRALGNLEGVNDLKAYQQVGEMINEQGGFNHLITDEQRASAQKASKPGQTVKSRLMQNARSNQDLNARRRAASPTKAATSTRKTAQTPTTNPLALSDEEYMKQFGAQINY